MPMRDGTYGYGQIVAPWGKSGGHFYFVIFDAAHDVAPPVEDVVTDNFALLALSMDALLHHGHWQVVGHHGVDARRISWPEYKEGTAPGRFNVVDASGEIRRPATAEDVAHLPFRKMVAPIRVQHAFEALHGQRDWSPEYDHLRV
jgi:hypothetical protein